MQFSHELDTDTKTGHTNRGSLQKSITICVVVVIRLSLRSTTVENSHVLSYNPLDLSGHRRL